MKQKTIYPLELDILIIDDEEGYLEYYSMELASYGHKVVIAADFKQACNTLRSPNKFHLVITDLTMHSLPMTEIIGKITDLVRKHQPTAKILIISSASSETMAHYVNIYNLAGYISRGGESDVEAISSKIESLFPTQ